MHFLAALRDAAFGIFDYSGRADRLEQWSFCLLTAIVFTGLVACERSGTRIEGGLLLGVMVVAAWGLLAHVALFVRRLHDHNRSGLLLLIPLAAGSLAVLAWMCDSGRIDFRGEIFRDYGDLVVATARAIFGIVASYFVTIFLARGDAGENDFGDPVE